MRLMAGASVSPVLEGRVRDFSPLLLVLVRLRRLKLYAVAWGRGAPCGEAASRGHTPGGALHCPGPAHVPSTGPAPPPRPQMAPPTRLAPPIPTYPPLAPPPLLPQPAPELARPGLQLREIPACSTLSRRSAVRNPFPLCQPLPQSVPHLLIQPLCQWVGRWGSAGGVSQVLLGMVGRVPIR